MHFFIIIVYIIGLSTFIKCEYTNQDIDVMAHFKKFLNYKNFIILENSEDVNIIKKIRNLVGDLYHVTLNSSRLENILSSNKTQLNFFKKSSLILVKQNLDMNILLSKIIVPHLITWMIFKNVTEYDETLYIPFDSSVLFINSTPKLITAQQVYHVKPGRGKTIKTVWSWAPASSKPEKFGELKKNNFHNVSMNMHVLLSEEYCSILFDKDIVIKVECLHRELLRMVAVRLNFSINPVNCMNTENPFTYPNGTESELFIKLRSREVDLSSPSHIIKMSRISSFDFIWPTFVLQSMMYLKQTSLSGQWKSFLRPLDSSVWWTLFYWMLLSEVVTQIFEKILLKNFKFTVSLVWEFLNSLLTGFQIFCNQGIYNTPLAFSIRIVYILKFLVVLVFFQAYSGYLISAITISLPYFPFTDLHGFFENKKYLIMTVSEGLHEFYYSTVVGDGKKNEFMLKEDLPLDVQEAVNKLCEKDHLVFAEFREKLLDVNRIKCKILEIPSPVVYIYMTIVLPKNSPFREVINREMLHLRATGLIHRMRTQLSSHSSFFIKDVPEEYARVALSQVFPILVLLGIGIVLSFGIFFIEIFYKKLNLEKHSVSQ